MRLSIVNAPAAVTNSRNSYLATLEAAWAQHRAPRDADAPTVISTFAGCGGSSLGYSMAGFRELLAVEWDNNAAATFGLNFPEVPVHHGDIAQLSVEAVLAQTGLQPGKLDVFDGSPPCQGFSTAGKRVLDDPRNGLFREYVRLLRGLQPKVFVMENVSGMVKGKMKLVFAEILRDLKASGYQVSARLLNAMYFHVPQSRERMIFIGVRNDLGRAPSHPRAQRKPYTVRSLYPEVKQIRTYSAGYTIRWIDADRPQPTIGRDHAQKPTRWLINEKEHRPTTEQLSVISSFSTSFRFAGNDNDAWARIGNSVPPLFMRAIAQHIREHLL